MQNILIRDIEAFCKAKNLAFTTFGRLAVNDGKFVERIRKGGRCWPETSAKVRAYIDQNKPEKTG